MEINSLGTLVRTLKEHLDNKSTNRDENETQLIDSCARIFEDFNKSNEMQFRFQLAASFLNDLSPQEKDVFFTCLNSSWSFLIDSESSQAKEKSSLHSRQIAACLNSIRIISRDSEAIKLFENAKLLEIIQTIANLMMCLDDKNITLNVEKEIRNSESISNLRLHALKAMSNLIYNNKFVQDFYITNGVAEMITVNLKQFSPGEFLSMSSGANASSSAKLEMSVVIFHLRILFLLTVFNRELRLKLREKLQVITYLIEIIDQVMKERLNGGSTSAMSSFDMAGVSISDESTGTELLVPADYCLLKLVDVAFIIEILKVLFNLTMDMAPQSKINTLGTGSLGNTNSNTNEEDEAHLMHLVSVLRDLITCRLEQITDGNDDSAASLNNPKLIDLHSNVINLLTNMPSTCYEELLSPLNPLPSNVSTINNSNAPMSNIENEPATNYYLNVRMAHNRKRISRRSKRMKQQQQQKQQQQLDEMKMKQNLEDLTLAIDDPDVEFEGKNMEAVSIILAFMNRYVNTYTASPNGSNASALSPVLLLLTLMSKSNKLIRQYCRRKVLPPLKRIDLLRLPQQGNQLRNKLVRLMTDPNLQLKRLSAQFLFVLCKESVQRLIKYTGFGNAAGLLAEMGLMLSKQGGDISAYSSSESDDQGSDTEDYKQLESCINPVTGRAEVEPSRDPFEGMSEEQKEYEAIRLVNDLDRLTRIGGCLKPARIGSDGRPVAIEHVLELQNAAKVPNEKSEKNANNND